jgi:cell division transport system ATP-binding protein
MAKRVRAALDQVGLLKYEQSRPVELSTGEQQRVGLARAVVTKPPLLIADEPTGNLDPDLSLEVMNIFRRFQEVGVTVLIASHNVKLIEQFNARRIHLEGGRLVEDGNAGGSSAPPMFDPSRLLDQSNSAPEITPQNNTP